MDVFNYEPKIRIPKEAQLFLNKCSKNCLETMEHLFDDLVLNQEVWTDLVCLQNDVKRKLELFVSNFEPELECAINCVFYNRLHDFLMPLVYEQFEEEDQYFCNKILQLCALNVTAEQIGAPVDYAIPLLAGVVELSSLDSYKSPMEKLQCLCTTYDLIFAELKCALIEIIASQQDSEATIPVINNSDITPILISVIIQSKLIHIHSNLYYIETFIGNLEQESNFKHVLNRFKEALEGLKLISKESLKPSCEKVLREVDLLTVINISSQKENGEFDNATETSLLDRQILRVTDLIINSTNENYSIV